MPTPAPINENATIDEILHAIVVAGIVAASIFVKNPASQAQAGKIINAVNQVVLPVVDSLLNPTPQS